MFVQKKSLFTHKIAYFDLTNEVFFLDNDALDPTNDVFWPKIWNLWPNKWRLWTPKITFFYPKKAKWWARGAKIAWSKQKWPGQLFLIKVWCEASWGDPKLVPEIQGDLKPSEDIKWNLNQINLSQNESLSKAISHNNTSPSTLI